jgi:hypothetical protein
MIYLSRLILFLLLCLPHALQAQSLKITSGEHENFTRLVVPVPRGAAWNIDQSGRIVTFSLTESNGDYDTSGVFALVPRERLTDIYSESGTVTVTLGCDCKVTTFVTRDRFVVLDVSALDVALDGNVIQTTDADGVKVGERIDNPLPGPSISLPLVPKRSGASFSPSLQPTDLPLRAREPQSVSERAALNAMQERLVKELSKAATQGVLTSDTGHPFHRGEQQDETGRDVAEQAKPKALPDVSRQSANNMRVTSSKDLAPLQQTTLETLSISEQNCTTNEDLDVVSWADDAPFHIQLGQARQNLYGEFDRLDTYWAIKLAKLFLHFGFGAEALSILSLDPDLKTSESLLYELAHIFEHGKAPTNSNLRASLDCETDVALWAILAKEDLEIAHEIDPNAALRALNKLPVHLRDFLAPALSERFLSHGDTNAAASALRSLERQSATLPAAAKMAQANIAIDEGDINKGANTLADVIDDNVSQSPRALITLVETKHAAGEPITPEIASLVEAYAKEYDGAEIGPALRRAHVLALVKSGQFDQAFQVIHERGVKSEDPDAIELLSQVLREVITEANDVVFLEHLFAQDQRDINRLPTRPKLLLAKRLIQLGFPKRAEPVVTSIPDRPLDSERQILLAEISLELGQPQKGLAALIQVDSNEADIIRAKAHLLANEHLEAAAIFRKVQNTEAAQNAEWLADNIENGSPNADSIFGPILALSQSTDPTSTSVEGMLQRSENSLKESETARQTILELLLTPQLEIADLESIE